MRHWCKKCRGRRLEVAMRQSGFSHNKIQLWECLDCNASLPSTKNNKNNTKERFQKKVKIDIVTGCHLWTGTPLSGYGVFTADGVTYKAHRLAYILYKGAIPTKLLVCHSCDNRLCVNPDHLFLGTIQDNMDDRNNKGRQARGERSHSKLKNQDILVIRELSRIGVSQRRIAKRLGVGKSTINSILNGHNWTHV